MSRNKLAINALLLLTCVFGFASRTSVAAQEQTKGLDQRTADLQIKILDLVFRVEDLGGKTQDLGGKVQDLQIKESAAEIRIELAADVLFDFDKADIRPKAQEALKQAASLIRDKAKGVVRIEGHTDSKGNDPYNQSSRSGAPEPSRPGWLKKKVCAAWSSSPRDLARKNLSCQTKNLTAQMIRKGGRRTGAWRLL